ncbi:hypothetical protein SUGI_0588350 [Cryptomeria japonica]|nr:hypothetical protein SUGI_0588350 [Cryptomeria japonica]
MESELQEVTRDKQSDVAKDNNSRKFVKWRTLEVDWDDYGVKQTGSNERGGNIGWNMNCCTEAGKGSSTGDFEIDLSECIENEKVIFDQHAIIAKFLGPKLSRKEILAWVLEQWGRSTMVKFIPKGFFVAVFPNEGDRDHIITLQNWFRNDHPLYIQSWSPNFDPTSMAAYDKPVWIRSYNLSIEYWSEACLEMISRSLGTLFVRKAYKCPGKKPEQVWKTKEKTQVHQETLLLEGPKINKCKDNPKASSDIPIKDPSVDGNLNPNNDTLVYPVDELVVEEELQVLDSETAEQGSDDDDLNIVDPRHISQFVNIILGRAKATRGRKSHKTVREQRANEKGIVSMMKFLKPVKGGKPSLGGR